ncbi:hypothetical protein BKI52_36125 [marine bacterium AO1-C]|nr:hypothetical protein BKI52_36125 [marine bacterium AO1-C]
MHQHSIPAQHSEDQRQTTVLQQKKQKQSQATNKKAIQAKQQPIQRKAKPPIQSKHKPVQAKQAPIQRLTSGQEKKGVPQGSAKFKEIATTMGEQHGVDTSPLKANHNSAFPGTVNAAATIQGNKIDFAPREDTTSNMKHEVAHYIDNTKNGVPNGDQVVNGQKVDTTREKVVDKMAKGTLQRKSTEKEGKEGLSSQTGIIQRRVILTRDKERADDKVEKNSIRFSQRLVGGEFQTFTNADFSSVKDKEKIAFVGHGDAGVSGDHTAKEIADKLTGTGAGNEGKGLPDGNHDIIFTSCYAGTEKMEKEGDDEDKKIDNGVVAYVDRAMIAKWPGAKFTIKGAKGPSIKTLDENGNQAWAVVNESDVGVAGILQNELSNGYGITLSSITKAPEDHDGFESSGLTKASRDEYQSAELTSGSDEVQGFFLDFINAVNGNWGAITKEGQDALKGFVNNANTRIQGIRTYLENNKSLPPKEVTDIEGYITKIELTVDYIKKLQEADPVSIGASDNMNIKTHK